MATMSARYTIIDGEVVAQERGGVRHQLVPDPLGSTVALYDSVGTKTDTFGYWPYGESASRTGTTTAKFQYVGTAGYYQYSTTKVYVRARFLDAKVGRWTTEDPIGFTSGQANFYTYVDNNPNSYVDFFGLQKCSDFKCPKKPGEGWTKLTPEKIKYWRQYYYCKRCLLECDTWCNSQDTSIGSEPIEIGNCKQDCAKRMQKCQKDLKHGF